MMVYEFLQHIGYSSSDISDMITSGKLLASSDGVSINDYNLLLEVINKYDKSYPLFDYFNDDINHKVDELIKLIKYEQYKLAYEFALKLYNELAIPEVKLIIDNIDKEKDNLKYIIDESYYTNEVVINGFKKMERNMLIDFLCGDEVEGTEKITQLAKLYIHQHPIPFNAFRSYLAAIADLRTNHVKTITRKDGAIGSPLAVICTLVKCGDYYRAHEVLNECYLKHNKEEYSVIWEILKYMDVLLMDTLKLNVDKVYERIRLNSNGLNTVKEIIDKKEVSSLDDETIRNMFKKEDYSIDHNINYFNEYTTHKEERNYEEARKDIVKHQRLMGERGIFCDYDYLIKETDILSYNQTYSTEEELNKKDELLKDAYTLMEEKRYEEAINKLYESFKYEKKHNPYTYSKIAECYMELQNYEKAAHIYKVESLDYLYPIDYLHYIECLYRIEKYEDIFKLAEGYDYYYPQESSFVYYILSICYAIQGNYKLALDNIDTCEIISMEYYDIALNFNYERSIIKELDRGKNVPIYTLDDYYDHCFSEKTLQRIKELDIESLPEDGSLLMKIIDDNNERIEDKLDFLLKLSKVLKEMERNKDALDVLKYIEEIIKTSSLSPTDNEHFTVVLRNYRKL